MNKLQKISFLNKYPYQIMIGLVLLAVIFGSAYSLNQTDVINTAQNTNLREVDALTVSDYATVAGGTFAPTAAGNSFVVRAESSGRINTVATAGEDVEAGDILAKIDNRSQLAALTQAQGAYEAALASAEQSRFSVESQTESLNQIYSSANSTLRSTLIDTENVMQNTMETFFKTPTIDYLDLRNRLRDKKQIDYDTADWNENTAATLSGEELTKQIDTAIDVTYRLYLLINDVYDHVVSEENGVSAEYAATLATYRSQLLTAQDIVSAALETLRSTKLNIQNNEAALLRAESSSAGGNTSAIEAQIKQALGSLEAAKAAYAKTIVSAPFTGKVTSLNVSVGDIINIGTDIAIIVPEAGTTVDHSFNLPIKAVKYTPTGAYVLTITDEGKLDALSVETGLVTADRIKVTGLTGSEKIVGDVRGLKAGEEIIVK